MKERSSRCTALRNCRQGCAPCNPRHSTAHATEPHSPSIPQAQQIGIVVTRTSRGVRWAAHRYCHSSVAFIVGQLAAVHTGSSATVSWFRSVINCLCMTREVDVRRAVSLWTRETPRNSPNVFKHPHVGLDSAGKNAEMGRIHAGF